MKNMTLKPMPIYVSVMIFFGAALIFLVTERYLVPALHNAGVPPIINFLILGSPHVLLFTFALVAYKNEGNNLNLRSFKERFRLKPIKGKLWLLIILFVAIDVGLYLLVYSAAYPVVEWLYKLYPTPEAVNAIFGDETTFAGYELHGRWWILGVYFIVFFFNIFGEEFLWRGYIFPRQELKHGKYTWVVHGLLWTGFHIFAPYNALMVLPGALFMSFIVQKYKNTWIFILSHATLNAVPMIIMITKIAA